MQILLNRILLRLLANFMLLLSLIYCEIYKTVEITKNSYFDHLF